MNWFIFLTYQVVFVVGWIVGLHTIKWYIRNDPAEFLKKFKEEFADALSKES